MTALEELLLLTQTQSIALNKATKVLAEALTQIQASTAHIVRLQNEIDVLRLDLREAREGRSVRQ